jgi:hypothetical protein
MSGTLPLLLFWDSMAYYRDTFTVTSACYFYIAADSIDDVVFVWHMAV